MFLRQRRGNLTPASFAPYHNSSLCPYNVKDKPAIKSDQVITVGIIVLHGWASNGVLDSD